MTYSGWTNYETWAVKLWLDNEHGSYLDMTEHATEFYREHVTEGDPEFPEDAERDAVSAMSDYVKEQIEEGNPVADQASVYADLMNAALSEVDWREIGQAYIEEARESVTT